MKSEKVEETKERFYWKGKFASFANAFFLFLHFNLSFSQEKKRRRRKTDEGEREKREKTIEEWSRVKNFLQNLSSLEWNQGTKRNFSSPLIPSFFSLFFLCFSPLLDKWKEEKKRAKKKVHARFLFIFHSRNFSFSTKFFSLKNCNFFPDFFLSSLLSFSFFSFFFPHLQINFSQLFSIFFQTILLSFFSLQFFQSLSSFQSSRTIELLNQRHLCKNCYVVLLRKQK